MKKAIVIGSGQLALNCARELLKNEYDVIIYEYNAYGMSLLSRNSQKLGVGFQPMTKVELTQVLLDVSEETFVVSANNTYLLPEEVLKNDKIIAINFHPALLPLYPGRNAECWAIFNMDEKSGVTWHFVNKEVDKGDIILQESIELSSDETAISLMMKQFKLGTELFQEILVDITNCGFENLNRMENFTSKDDIHLSTEIPNNACLDLEWSVEKMYAFCRSVDYGALRVMKKPFCVVNGCTYIWDKYYYDKNLDNCESDMKNGIFANKDYVLKFFGWHIA